MEQTATDSSFISWKGELCRKAVHLFSLIMPIGFYVFNSQVIYAGIGTAFIASALFDIQRMFGWQKIRQLIIRYFGFMFRPREKKAFSGSTAILLAALIVYRFFDLRVAAASMIIIIIGDPAAALIGRRFGTIRFRNKSLQGTLAFIVFAAIFVWFIPGLEFKVAFSGVLLGALVEFLPLYIDDNLLVPVLSGMLMQLMINHQAAIGFAGLI